uniref:Reelin domain-containing protein n=1 Tax=Biomphalaria glabrata TaxID=6526 RepID=A0A2C9LBT9_BIOGL
MSAKTARLLLSLTALWTYASCYPDGMNVDEACSDMTPRHNHQGQTSASPFKITFCPNWYKQGSSVNVTLTGTSMKFKGFMIQARSNTDSATSVGTFTATNYTRNACTSKALVHSSAKEKTQLTFKWMAPSTASGNITFWVTFVEDEDVFWVATKSSVLMDATNVNVTVENCTMNSDIVSNSAVRVGSYFTLMFVVVSSILISRY